MASEAALDDVIAELQRDVIDVQRFGHALLRLRGQDQLAVAAMIANVADHCEDEPRREQWTQIAAALALRGAKKFARTFAVPMPYPTR